MIHFSNYAMSYPKVVSSTAENRRLPDKIVTQLKILLMEEIRRSSVDMANIPLSTWFYTSQVVQDFFHQPYVAIFPEIC